MKFLTAVPDLIKGAFGIVDELVEDKDLANSIKGKLKERFFSFQEKVIEYEGEVLKAKTSTITAEANGDSWLQKNWRPLTMVNFVFLVTAHWLGFTPENIGEAEVIALLDIVKIGLGGYVVGRSGEKIANIIGDKILSKKDL